MKNKIVLRIIILFIVQTSLFAQKGSWTIGFYTGVQRQIILPVEHLHVFNENIGKTISESMGLGKTISTVSKTPAFELIVQYKITNYFSLNSGIGYKNYCIQWNKLNSSTLNQIPYDIKHRSDNMIIPFVFQYDIPFKKHEGFSFFVKLGVLFDFFIVSRDLSIIPKTDLSNVFMYQNKEYKPVFSTTFYNVQGNDILVQTVMGCSYQFLSGIGISLSGAYNIGTLVTNKFSYNFQLKDINTDVLQYTFDYFTHSKSVSWNLLLGITYTFKHKNI